MSAFRNSSSVDQSVAQLPVVPAEVPPVPEVKISKRPPLPRPDTSRTYGPQGRGDGKVHGSQSGNRASKQFAFRKH